MSGAALSNVLPGAPQLLAGRWGVGLAALGTWVLMWSVLLARYQRVAEAVRIGPTDARIAVAALIVGLVAAWAWSARDVRRGGAGAGVGVGRWGLAARAFARNPLAVAAVLVLLAAYLVAVLTPLVAPYPPGAQGDLLAERLLPPSPGHWLGTDQYARDVLSRILYGARISLSVGFIAVGISATLGTLLGAAAGYLGGLADTAVMRFVDVVIAFPRLVLIITLVALFQPSIFAIVLILGLTQWPGTARLVRAEVLSLREREFVQAARALGFSRRRVVLKHVIPNTLAPVIVAASLGIGHVIVLEAGLSFLGLGVQPPTPSWGSMVYDGAGDRILSAWWISTFSGLAIVVVVLAFNLVGDGLRDAFDPRLRGGS